MYIWRVCKRAARKENLTLTLTLTHTITAYSVSGSVIRVRILICATIQTPCRKVFTTLCDHILAKLPHTMHSQEAIGNTQLFLVFNFTTVIALTARR